MVPARVAMPVLVAVGAIDGALTLAVVALYRTTMRGLHDDLRLALGEQAGRDQKPDQAGRKRPSQPRSAGVADPWWCDPEAGHTPRC